MMPRNWLQVDFDGRLRRPWCEGVSYSNQIWQGRKEDKEKDESESNKNADLKGPAVT